MIVELLHLDFPRDAIALCVVLEGDWEIATLVELAELGGPAWTDFVRAFIELN